MAYYAIIHYNNYQTICQASENVYFKLNFGYFSCFVVLYNS